MTWSETAAFHFHRLRRESSNFSLTKSLRVDGHIVSQHQSGTHWLKFMLANALARHYGTPPPRFNHANDIIGGPKDAVVYAQLPRLISSHAIPPLGICTAVRFGLLRMPKYILLVRDIRASLVSNYRKWEQRYGVTFATFLDGDPAGRRYNSDIWWCFRFQNAWARLRRACPGEILTVHYEALQADTTAVLATIVSHLDLPLTQEDIRHGVASASKQTMQSHADPGRPPGEVHTDNAKTPDWFGPAERERFSRRCRQFLDDDFGYDYDSWE